MENNFEYEIRLSSDPSYKYDAYYKDQIIPFGCKINKRQFKDRTVFKFYSHQDHNDPELREVQRERLRYAKTSKGNIAYLDPYSPIYWCYNFLY